MRASAKLLICVALATGFLSGCDKAPKQVVVAPVRSAKLTTTFVADAETKAISASVSSRIVAKIERLLVREGAHVEKGAIVGYLDVHDLEASAREADMAVSTAESDVRQAREAVRAAQSSYVSAVAVAETAVKEATARLNAVQAGPRTAEIEAARHRIESLRAVMEEADSALARAQTLYDEGVISKSSLEQADSRAKLARQQYEAAEDDLRNLIAGPREESIRAAEAAVEVARMQLEAARAGKSEITLRQAAVEQALARVRQARATAARVKISLDDRLLRSPLTGMVQKLNVEAGEIASPGLPLLTVVDPRTMYVEAQVGDEDSAKVHIGQLVRISSASYPGRSFNGKVREINASAERKLGAATDRRVLRVRVEILEGRQLFSPGMEVDVAGVSSTKAATLLVPNDAVVLSGGQTFVWRLVDGSVEQVIVKLGDSNFAESEVFGNLKAGDQVVIKGKENLSAGAQVQTKGR